MKQFMPYLLFTARCASDFSKLSSKYLVNFLPYQRIFKTKHNIWTVEVNMFNVDAENLR